MEDPGSDPLPDGPPPPEEVLLPSPELPLPLGAYTIYSLDPKLAFPASTSSQLSSASLTGVRVGLRQSLEACGWLISGTGGWGIDKGKAGGPRTTKGGAFAERQIRKVASPSLLSRGGAVYESCLMAILFTGSLGPEGPGDSEYDPGTFSLELRLGEVETRNYSGRYGVWRAVEKVLPAPVDPGEFDRVLDAIAGRDASVWLPPYPSHEAAQGMRTCPRCHALITAHVDRCTRCGLRLPSPSPPGVPL